jgi:hypothetical protein
MVKTDDGEDPERTSWVSLAGGQFIKRTGGQPAFPCSTCSENSIASEDKSFRLASFQVHHILFVS